MPRRGSRFLAGRASNPLAARFREIERAIRRRQRFNTSEVTTIVNNAISGGGGGGGGGSPDNSVIVDDEGVQQGTAERMDFVGGGVTASVVGNTATIDVPDCCCDEELILSGGYWQTPDHASLDITGDIDLRAAVAPTDWTPAVNMSVLAKWNPNSYGFNIRAAGLGFLWDDDGTGGTHGEVSSVGTGAADGSILGIRATYQPGSAVVRFYTKTVDETTALADITSNVGWTQLGSDQATAGSSIFSGSAPVLVGVIDNGGTLTEYFTGVVYAVIVMNGVSGTVVTNPDFGAQAVGTTSFVDGTGKTWTLEGQSATPVGCLGDTDLYDDGVFQGTVKELDFTGSGVTATASGDRATIDVPSDAPANADYLVGTAQAGLSAEIVVGTTPGGELGGTWASPTVDATHSGSAHSDFIAKAIVAAKGDLISATADDTPAILTVGADGEVLVVDSGEATGLRWGTAAAGATVDIEDEGVTEGAADTIDFTGAGVSVSFAAGKATVDIPGGGGGSGYALVSQTYIAQGTTTYNLPAGIDAILVEAIGAGGGGGGVASAASSAAGGAGGGGGGYASVWITSPASSYAVVVGQGGAGGASGNNAGSGGGTTTFDSPSICTATGGSGGTGRLASTTATVDGFPAGGAGTVGDLLLAGGVGSGQVRMSGTSCVSGRGGDAARAGGGAGGRNSQGAGSTGGTYGGGGSGGCVINGGGNVAGGDGADGRIIVWEYAAV